MKEKKIIKILPIMKNKKSIKIRFTAHYDGMEYSICIPEISSESEFNEFVDHCKEQIGATLEWPEYFHFIKLDEKEGDEVVEKRRADDYLNFIRNQEANKGKWVWECATCKEFYLREQFNRTLVPQTGPGERSFSGAIIFANPYRMDTNYVKKWPPVEK